MPTAAIRRQVKERLEEYGLALQDRGPEAVLERVGVEPSGDAFNSIVFDERNQRPDNPMINAGALVTTDLVRGGSSDEKFGRILEALRRYAGNDRLEVDEAVLRSEMEPRTATARPPTSCGARRCWPATWRPDEFRNSVRGVRVCHEISERLGLHVFATEDEDSLLGRAEPRS